MHALVWKYQNEGEQRVWFRGRVRRYEGCLYQDHACAEVRPTRGAAMRDAKKLLAELNK